MTPEQIDRVFGCGRLQMVTGRHVEVFREASTAGARRRYTKRFLHTPEADFGQWTEREWRILARLIGHGIACVPEVVQYDRDAPGGTQLVQTYDAGATVDQWATILPVTRNGRMLRHVFEDCAHWWALAHHCLRALQAIHELSVVHLDIKGDNVCIPVGPAGFDPHGADLRLFPRFADLALIDFAFSLVSRESLTTALPIGWQPDYDYQSPRLLHALEAGRRGDLQPTRQLDWRCDMYSLAAMLKRYLPDDEVVHDPAQAEGWSAAHLQAARELILALREVHDEEATLRHPHARLLERTEARLADPGMATSLAVGWVLARDANVTPVAATPATPVTRLAPPLRVMLTPRVTIESSVSPAVVRRRPSPQRPPPPPPPSARRGRLLALSAVLLLATVGAVAVGAPEVVDRWAALGAWGRTMSSVARAAFERVQPRSEPPASAAVSGMDPQAPGPATPAPVAGQLDARASKADAGETAQSSASAPKADAGVGAQAAASDAPPPTVAPAPAQERRAEPTRPTRSTKATTTPAPAANVPASRPRPPGAVAARTGANRGARTAGVPSGPPKLAQGRPRPSAASGPKIAPTVAVTAPPTRNSSLDGEPTRIAASAGGGEPVAAPAAPSGEKKAPAAAPSERPAVESVVAAPAEATAPPKLAPAPSLPPKEVPPAINEQRSTLPALADLALRRERGSAPIEERSVPSMIEAPARAPARDGGVRMPPAAPPAYALPPSAAASAATEPRPVPRVVGPRIAAPSPFATPDPYRGGQANALDLAAQARRALAESVPHAAARAQGEVARVLRVAAHASHPGQEGIIVDAVQRGWPNYQIAPSVAPTWPGSARQLHEEARRAYVVQRDVRQAFELQLRAFGANPRDPEIAGSLAYLYLKADPVRAETARQLSLHAIALRSSQNQAARVDDWSTLAIASALTAREADSAHAWYVAVALARDLDRSCRAALGAVDRFGDIMVAPVQAMMLRIRQHGRDRESPNCSWPLGSRMARGY